MDVMKESRIKDIFDAKPSPRCVVAGGGKSGLAAARLLRAKGAAVLVIDGCGEEAFAKIAEKLSKIGAEGRAGVVDFPEGEFDLCVVSPAIPMGHPWLAACEERGIPVVAEMELGYVFWPGRILAVTGSKGKSSLVKLCAGTLALAGHRSLPCGNYGIPLCDLVVDHPDLEWAVAETSSFQLEHCDSFRPEVAVLLNLQADHLDRHASMEEYAAMKLRLFRRQSGTDVALLPDVIDLYGLHVEGAAMQMRFGDTPGATWRYSPGCVDGSWWADPIHIGFVGTWFDNPVLGLAAAAACGALTACGLTPEEIRAGLRAFQPLPHRMQHVAETGGVLYVDDSKATSLAATAAAIRMVQRPVRLIAGGRLKEKNLAFVKVLLTNKVKKVYLIGEGALALQAAWGDAVPCQNCHDMAGAVKLAASEARPGEAVLLSPGCASFDQFASYGERGDCFTHLVATAIAQTGAADKEEEK